MERENIIKEVVKIIKYYLTDDYKVLLFGSWAKNNALETSDIDIAIFGNKKTPWDIMAKILNDKEKIHTLRSIDIIDLNAKGDDFKKNVLKYAKILS